MNSKAILLLVILALVGGVGAHYLEERVLNPDFELINSPESFAPTR